MIEIQDYMVSLFEKSYISSTFDSEQEVLIVPKDCTENCKYNLVIKKDDFNEILIKSRAKNPLSEAILLNISNMIEKENFDIVYVYITISKLFEIYDNKCKQYVNEKNQTNSLITNYSDKLKLDNELDLTDFTALDTLNNEYRKEDITMTTEEFNNYRENVNTIIADIATLSTQNTLLDILGIDTLDTNEEINNLQNIIISLIPHCTQEEQQILISALIKPIFTQELDTDDIVNIYKLLANKALEIKDTILLDKLFNPFLQTIYNTSSKEE